MAVKIIYNFTRLFQNQIEGMLKRTDLQNKSFDLLYKPVRTYNNRGSEVKLIILRLHLYGLRNADTF
jgi:hypothetical protein